MLVHPAALHHAVAIGAATAALSCHRLTVASAPPLRLYTAIRPIGGPVVATRVLGVSATSAHGRTHCRLAHKGAIVADAMSIADARTLCP